MSPYHLKCRFSYEEDVSAVASLREERFLKVLLAEIHAAKLPGFFLLMLLKTREFDFC